jgi:hypothetical protein
MRPSWPNKSGIVAQRFQDEAELIEREKQEAVNAVNAKHFEETQRLTGKLEDLARQLERKTANELGEGVPRLTCLKV